MGIIKAKPHKCDGCKHSYMYAIWELGLLQYCCKIDKDTTCPYEECKYKEVSNES